MTNCISSTTRCLFEKIRDKDYNSLFIFYNDSTSSSYKCCLSSIILDCCNTFIAQEHIGSIAFQDSKDYARYNHDHDNYTSVTYTSTFNPPEGKNEIKVFDIKNAGCIKNYIQTVDKSEEIEKEYKKYMDPIGTLQFVERNGKIPSDQWVLADGSSLDVSQYKEEQILRQYFEIIDNKHVRIPNINGFFKPHTSMNDTSLNIINGSSGYTNHNHSIDYSTVNIDVNIKDIKPLNELSVEMYKNASTSNLSKFVHGGKMDNTRYKRDITHTHKGIFLTFENIPTIGTERESGDTITETYPDHQNIAAYIYVGDKK